MAGGKTKNLRYGAGDLNENFDDIFTPGDKPSFDVDNMEDIYDLDVENISKEADILAAANIQNLLKLYNNKEFTDDHPDFRKRIDTEIESLRKLYKMSKMDEQMHDHLCLAIAKNPGNASLYRAANELQRNILAIDKQIRDQIQNFNKIISSYQLELNFAQESTTEDTRQTTEMENGSVLSRGNKSFIEEMKNRQASLFENIDEFVEDEQEEYGENY